MTDFVRYVLAVVAVVCMGALLSVGLWLLVLARAVKRAGGDLVLIVTRRHDDDDDQGGEERKQH